MEEKKVEEKSVGVSVEESKKEVCVKKHNCCNTNTKKAVIVAVLIIIAALGFYFRGFLIAATVNGSPISRFDVMREAEKQDGKSILDNLIIKKIVRDEAIKQKITITKAEVDAQVAKLEEQLKGQNSTLDQALAQQGMTRASLEEQITLQKIVEKIVPKGAPITDEEINAYMKANKIVAPAGQETSYRAEAKAQMEQSAFSKSAQAMIDSLKAKASIQYLVKY